MEIKKEFIARLHNKDKHSVRITDSGIFEYKVRINLPRMEMSNIRDASATLPVP